MVVFYLFSYELKSGVNSVLVTQPVPHVSQSTLGIHVPIAIPWEMGEVVCSKSHSEKYWNILLNNKYITEWALNRVALCYQLKH